MGKLSPARTELQNIAHLQILIGFILVGCGVLSLVAHSYFAKSYHGFWTGPAFCIFGFLAIKQTRQRTGDSICFLPFLLAFIYIIVAVLIAFGICAQSIIKDKMATFEKDPDWCFDGCCPGKKCPNISTQERNVNLQKENMFKPNITCSEKRWVSNCHLNVFAIVVTACEMGALFIGALFVLYTPNVLARFEPEETAPGNTLIFPRKGGLSDLAQSETAEFYAKQFLGSGPISNPAPPGQTEKKCSNIDTDVAFCPQPPPYFNELLSSPPCDVHSLSLQTESHDGSDNDPQLEDRFAVFSTSAAIF